MVAVSGGGPQFFRATANILRDDCVCGRKNCLSAAIVLRQNDNGCLAERTFKVFDVAHVCAAELVNALVAIAYDAYVLVQLTQHENNAILRLVGVLKLVDENVFEAFLVIAQNVGVLFEEANNIDQQVIEVHCTGAHETGLILAIDLCVATCSNVLGGVEGFCGSDKFVLPQTDACLRCICGKLFGIESHVANDIAHQPL